MATHQCQWDGNVVCLFPILMPCGMKWQDCVRVMVRMKSQASVIVMMMLPLHTRIAKKLHALTNTFVIPTAHAKAFRFATTKQCKSGTHVMTRMKPYASMTTISEPLMYAGTAAKPGMPTSVVARLPAHAMAMSKQRSHTTTTVRSTD